MKAELDEEDSETEPVCDVQVISTDSSLDIYEPNTKDRNDLNRFNGGKLHKPFSCSFCEKRFICN